jgi:hypothetical protein
MVDAAVLNTAEGQPSCGFESHLRHHDVSVKYPPSSSGRLGVNCKWAQRGCRSATIGSCGQIRDDVLVVLVVELEHRCEVCR